MASFLIKDVRIFDGTSAIEFGSVLVENGKISQVSSSPISFSGTTYSKPGHTLLPGLIDVHIHADGGNDVALPQSLRFGRCYFPSLDAGESCHYASQPSEPLCRKPN